MKTLRTWLLASLAAATVTTAASGEARAATSPLGAYGTRAEVITFLSNYTDGGTGATTATRDYSAYNSGGFGIHGIAMGGLSSGALHSYAFASHNECHSVAGLFNCTPDGVSSRVAMWDTIAFLDVDGQPREVSSLIPMSITVDGDQYGESHGAMLRSYFGFDSNIDPETLPWVAIGGGQTELLDTLFVPLTDAPMFIYMELGTYASTAGELSQAAASDYLNTLHFNWVLPDGLTYASASGVFMTETGSSAAPEPASWALMIGGFGLAGAALRRRRRLQAA